MAEHQLPKLNTRVRFPSSAPVGAHLTNVGCVLFLLAPAQSCFADSMPKAKIPPSSRMAGFRLSKKWFARKSCTKEAMCMPARSGHGFVQLVSCGLRAALFILYCPRRARRSRISRSAERDQGAALDLQGASPLTHNPWQSIERVPPHRKSPHPFSRVRGRSITLCRRRPIKPPDSTAS